MSDRLLRGPKVQSGSRSGLEWGLRLVLAPALVVLLVASMGAVTSNSARVNNLSQQMMCVCGCNELLANCNHVTCPDSPVMMAQIRADVAKGMTNHQIFEAFEAQYGATVLAAPMLTRFNVVAWVMPPLILIVGLFGVGVLVRKWRLRSASIPPPAEVEHFDQLRDRIRKETDL